MGLRFFKVGDQYDEKSWSLWHPIVDLVVVTKPEKHEKWVNWLFCIILKGLVERGLIGQWYNWVRLMEQKNETSRCGPCWGRRGSPKLWWLPTVAPTCVGSLSCWAEHCQWWCKASQLPLFVLFSNSTLICFWQFVFCKILAVQHQVLPFRKLQCAV